VTVYQLVDRLDRLGARRAFFDLYHQALERYRARDFRGSMELFQQAQALAPDDFTTTMYLNRARVYAVKPPDIDWDGVYELEGK
jgi:adenylate cyclase